MKIKSIDITHITGTKREIKYYTDGINSTVENTNDVNLLDRIHCLLTQATSSYSSKAYTTEYNTNSV